MTCETCGRPKRDGLFQLGEAIFKQIEPHLTAGQSENVHDAITGFMAGEKAQQEYDL